uniref:SUEL-type lectin domain-containing protein n=1 Tax=Parascaris equorum TaxID=6256 RepID=A0A914R1L9_PAREQ
MPEIHVRSKTAIVIMDYTKVLEQCRNKRKCKIVVKPSFFDRDPCPNTSKYLQISYKCKPISFDDQNFCEGSNMQLSCKQNKRLAIYSAQYGRTVNGQAMHCTPNTPVAK